MRVESAMSRSGLSKGTILELLPRHVTYLVSLMITGECSFLTGFILRILTSCSILTLSEKLGPDTRVYYFQLNQLLPILRFFDVSWSQVKPFELRGIDVRAGSSDILAGIAKVNSYISGTNKTPHFITGDLPGPLLYCVEELPWFQDEILSYYWKRDQKGNSIDEPIDHDDHAMNTVKYMLSKLPESSEIVVPSELLPPKWSYWHEMEMNEYKLRAGQRV